MKKSSQSQKESRSCGLCCTKVAGITVRQDKTEILKDVSFHIHCGEITAIIGPNGAGKTTLLKSILGIIRHSGELKFLDAKGRHSGKPVIGYVPQNIQLDRTSPVSVSDFFMASVGTLPLFLFRPASLRVRIHEHLARVQAGHLYGRKLGALSGGELQRVLLSLALIPPPDLLLLDEPVSAIDEPGTELFYSIVADLRNDFDLSIVIVSHDLDMVAERATRVVLLDKEVLALGTPAEVYKTEAFLRIFGRRGAKVEV